MKFSTRFAEALNHSGFSQKELANALNIAESNITNWKKGENLPSVDLLYKLCILLDESSDYLLGLKDDN
ncbi:MAG: helix-turn-helix transcriptional regulator [Clostridia bacterium]|nr:helix-turn-helix transcriptional regulator [Clostridia bacterium]